MTFELFIHIFILATCRSRATGSVEHFSRTWGRAFLEMWQHCRHFHYEHQNVLKSSPVFIINNIIITPTSATLLGVAWISRQTWIQSLGSARWTACKVSFLPEWWNWFLEWMEWYSPGQVTTKTMSNDDDLLLLLLERINLNLIIFTDDTATDLQHIHKLLELFHQHLHHKTLLR